MGLGEINISKMSNKTVPGRNTDTIIGAGVVFENALLKGNGIIRIDGTFSGIIDIEGHIILGKTGRVIGDINADSALMAGSFQGNLYIRNTLHLTDTASLSGKVETGMLIIDEGAILDGACNVTNTHARAAMAMEEPIKA